MRTRMALYSKLIDSFAIISLTIRDRKSQLTLLQAPAGSQF
jgi:hypothetical protein